ncbi:MAG: heme-copper oxidase subunit III [Chloroflexi bacterium]|nr:cytochrome c oxidase subunit 3 [Anaerolineaceae bacterium]NMB87070.1 heme-copper oxidase subunit III [Chloroflexota bacterium]
MSAQAQAISHQSEHEYSQKLATNRLGLWLFILSDGFMFGALFFTRFYLLGSTRPHLEQQLGFVVTAVLLVSSFFMNRAEIQIAHNDRKGFLTSTLITILLGVGFLAGVVGVEWRLAPFGPADGPEGAVFYMMTGMHAFHVLTGVLFLLIVLRNGYRGKYSAERHWAVEAAANYWHFVDVVWIFFYPALYLIGTV